LKDKISVV